MSEIVKPLPYGEPPDDEISAELWAWVHANYVRPTTDRSFYTFAALVEARHRAELTRLRAEVEGLREDIAISSALLRLEY